jgi:stage II sporulation protein M
MNIRIFKEGSIVEQYFKKNISKYIIILVVFAIGVLVGTFYLKKIDNVNDVSSYLQDTIKIIKSGNKINRGSVLKEALLMNLKTSIIIWLLGSAVFGIPLLLIYTGYRGFLLGFTISSILTTFGSYKGNLFLAGSLLPQNLIVIPCMILMVISGFKLSENVLKSKKSVKAEMLRHTVLCTISFFFMIIAAFIEAYFNTPIIETIIKSL